MGNAPSSENNDQSQNANNDPSTESNNEANKHNNNENKTVSFSQAPPQPVDSHDSDNNNSDNDKNNDDDEEEEDSEEASSPDRSNVPKRGLPGRSKSSYFDLVTGTRITATSSGSRGELMWRTSNKSIRMLTGDELSAPAPQWRRTLRRLGVVSESKAELVDTNNDGDAADGAGDSRPPSQKNLNQTPDPSMKHFRIQSRAVQNDNSSLLLDSTRTASLLSEYLRWTFHKSFFHVMLASFVQFLFLSVVFAIFIYAVDLEQPQCISGGTRRSAALGGDRDSIMFGDAYHLSWTTLSTVGYGVISPSLAKVDEADTRCLGLNVLMALEAFVGVLFGGVTGAIIFGKIARIQSIANVRFSHPVVIRYGLGVIGTGDNETDKNQDEDAVDADAAPDGKKKPVTGNANTQVTWPCPILEFRVVNELSERVGGEIMNATINVAACSLEKMNIPQEYASLRGTMLDKKKMNKKRSAPSPLRASGVIKHTGKALLGGTRGAAHATGNLIQKLHHGLIKPIHSPTHQGEVGSNGEEPKPFNAAEVEKQVKEQIARDMADVYQQSRQAVTVDEGNHQLAPRRIYFKLDIETDSHPFFKRVWNIRHVLDEASPLLSEVARHQIARNNGNWPSELNNHESIRKHVHFEELVVSLSGTSNVSGSSVYAQKIYDYEHLNIGYSFAPLLALDGAGRMVVDHRLLNDVREQQGGGGEPINQINQTAAESAQVIDRMEFDNSDFLE